MQEAVLRDKLTRSMREIATLEKLIEDRGRAQFLAQGSLKDPDEFLNNALQMMSSLLIVVDANGVITTVNEATTTLLGYAHDELIGQPFGKVIETDDQRDLKRATSPEVLVLEYTRVTYRAKNGDRVPVLFAGAAIRGANQKLDGVVCVGTDLSEQASLEVELRNAQTLESVGQLAAGVAHEINTPVQFIGDSIHFLQDAFTDIYTVLVEYRSLGQQLPTNSPAQDQLSRACDAEEEADLEFLEEEVPEALRRALDGIDRVASIVRAMKAFAHPGSVDQTPSDINQGIETTLIVSKNEYKYVADVELDLGEIPPVSCNISDINQVILNLVVNASHAIENVVERTGERGTIKISTHRDGDDAVIMISDTGGGIPEEVSARVFDPFFTTKEVGRGTGQGLSIARRLVQEKHGGKLSFESTDGVGTSFEIRLPIGGLQS